MDRATVERYEERGHEWAARRRPVRRGDAVDFGRRVPAGGTRLDAGAGGGRYTNELGHPVVAFDAAGSMLGLLREVAPEALLVQGDLEALPFRSGAIAATWANMSYLHIPRMRLPLALADLHRAMAVGAPLDLQVLHGDYEGMALPDDDIGGRFFASWSQSALHDMLTGAGFSVESMEVEGEARAAVVRVRAARSRSLADTVGEGMRVLVCGLNPSHFAADRGIAFARPGNRFWPAALAAGLVSKPNDPRAALADHGVGLTDLCKRATVGSDELSPAEYRSGAGRIERLVAWLRPRAVCFVGLEGWRAAVDARAVAGLQRTEFGGRPVYVMPSTSGRNASSRPDDLAGHLRAAAALAAETT